MSADIEKIVLPVLPPENHLHRKNLRHMHRKIFLHRLPTVLSSWIYFTIFAKIPPLWVGFYLWITPQGDNFYLSSIGGGHPLRSPRRHCLGRPLPYQLADTEQAIQRASCDFIARNAQVIKFIMLQVHKVRTRCLHFINFTNFLLYKLRATRELSEITSPFDELCLTLGYVNLLITTSSAGFSLRAQDTS